MAYVNSKKYGSAVQHYKKSSGDISYSITYKDADNRLKRVKIGEKSAGITEVYCFQKRNEIINRMRLGDDVPVKGRKKKRFTLQDAFDQYIEWAKGNKKSWKKDEGLYNGHISTLSGRELVSLKPADFERLKQDKLKSYSPRTVEYILAVARGVINHAIRHDLVKQYANPIANKRVKMPKVDNERLAFLSYEQARKLLDVLKVRHPTSYRFSVLMLFTGARFDEIARLTWQNIDLTHGLIHIEPSKNGNSRKVAITPLIEEVLISLNADGSSLQSPVIQNSKSKRWERMPKQWQVEVDKMFKGNDTAGKYRITPHTLRHTHASWLAKNGTDILRIKEQLGHKKLDMTLRYSHLIPDARHEKTKELYERFQDAT